MPRIGKRRHRITIQKRTIVLDEFGEADHTWTNVDGGGLWAEVEDVRIRSGEIWDANQERAIAFRKFRIRHCEFLTTDEHRIIYRGQVNDIEVITLLGHRRAHDEITCRHYPNDPEKAQP